MIRKILISSSIVLWGLVSFSQTALFEQYDQNTGLDSDEVVAVKQDLLGTIWFVHPSSVSALRGFDLQRYDLNLPEGDALSGMIVHREQNPRIYSKAGGIYEFESDGFELWDQSEQLVKVLDGRDVREIVQGRGGNLWVSLVEGGLLQMKSEQIMEFKFPYTEPLEFFGLEIDEGLFISGELNENLDQDRLIIFSQGRVLEVPLSSGDKLRSSSLLRSESSLLFYRGVELLAFNDRGILKREFAEKEIQCFLEDNEGKLWVGMKRGGLLCYPLGLESQNTAIRYLGDVNVLCLFEDENSTLWIGTANSGVYSFEQTTADDYTSPGVFSNVDTSQSTAEAIRLGYDPIVAPTDHGGSIDPDTIPPDVFVTAVRVKGRDTVVASSYKLPYDMNFFEFSFIGFSEFQELFQYRYRMTGVDEDWVFTSRNAVQYTALDPGEYTFEVQAINKSGLWSEESASIDITIRPPLWQRMWFRALIVLFVLGLSFGILYAWLRVQRREEKRRAELDRKISAMELRALRSQMNPHFLFNTLSSIQHFITENKSKEAIQYLSKFARLMRTILENSKRPEIPLRSELEALDLYLLLESFRFKEKFDYRIEVDDELDQDYDHIPPLLIQPYVENAIVHGMMHKPDKGNILVHLKKEGDMLLSIVEDDGVGREKAMEFKKKKHESSGLSITKERLEIINSTRKSNLSVEIVDLKDDAGEACGTRVEIYIPLED